MVLGWHGPGSGSGLGLEVEEEEEEEAEEERWGADPAADPSGGLSLEGGGSVRGEQWC